MNKVFAIVLLNVGIVLLIFGVSAMNSASSELSSFMTGAPSDKATWLLICGAVATALGGIGAVAVVVEGRLRRS